MVKLYALLASGCLMANLLFAQVQQPPAVGFGGMFPVNAPTEEGFSKEQIEKIAAIVNKNVERLILEGKVQPVLNANDTVQFGWPLKQAAGFSDPGYYGISNFLDWNTATGQIRDYNCGSRTYDGHRGTDIYTYPFPWQKMDQNAVEVIAGADGVIVAKFDGNPDTSCAFCASSCQWNAVYVRSNIDGTIAWYGHLKKNSLTSKAVGDAVSKGEYLGIVGSAGNSTGPHLHFEVWLNGNYNWLMDPYSGVCNDDGNRSLWETQQPYYVPSIVKLATATGQPQFSLCYEDGKGENPKEKNSFSVNETVYFLAYIRDNVPGKIYSIKIYKPDNTLKWGWSLNAFNTFYPSAWFYYFYPGSNFNIDGTWKFVVSYDGKTEEHPFVMSTTLPLSLVDFNGKALAKMNLLKWETTNEQNTEQFVVQRSADGQQFEQIGTIAAKGDGLGTGKNLYEFSDLMPQPGANHYRLLMRDKDGEVTYSKVINLLSTGPTEEFLLLTNPVQDQLRFVTATDHKNSGVRIIDQQGRVLITQSMYLRKNQQSQISVQTLARGQYFLQVLGNEGQVFTHAFIKK